MKIGDAVFKQYSDNAVSGNVEITDRGNVFIYLGNKKIFHVGRMDKNGDFKPMKSNFTYSLDSLSDHVPKYQIDNTLYSIISSERLQDVLKHIFTM